MTIYQHIRHPHIAAWRADRPVKVADQLPQDSAVNRFNTKVAIVITQIVGSMWCAYSFALFDLISLPGRDPWRPLDDGLLGGADLAAAGAAVDHRRCMLPATDLIPVALPGFPRIHRSYPDPSVVKAHGDTLDT